MDTNTIDIDSVGRLCGLFQRSPRSIREAAVALGVKAAFRINGVPHYTSEQTDLIAQHLSGEQKASAG